MTQPFGILFCGFMYSKDLFYLMIGFFIVLMLSSDAKKFLHLMQFILSKLSLMLVLFVLEEIFVYSEVMKVSYLYFIKIVSGFFCLFVFVLCFCIAVLAKFGMVCEILVPQPGIEPVPSAVKAQSPSH